MGKDIKVRITALETNDRRYAVVFMGKKVAVAFGRDSGAKVGYEAIMIKGRIASGGSRANWYCRVCEGSVFELEVDEELFHKNKNRIKKWKMEIIDKFSITKDRANQIEYVENNLE